MRQDTSAVLVSAARTPVGKFGGALSHMSAVELGGHAVAATLKVFGGELLPDYTLLGNVVQAGNGQNPARAAAIRGGVPTTVPGMTINDVCLGSMSAVGIGATMIRAGERTTVLVGGFESMSRAPHAIDLRAGAKIGPAEMRDTLVTDGLWCAVSDSGMGELSEVANSDLGIERAAQDGVAAASHHRAGAATDRGRFTSEITALTDVLESDEGIRPATDETKLARLSPAFTPDGSITAGNASQMSDAGAAGIITSSGNARALGITPIVEIVDRAVVSGPDATLHLKPAMAVRALLKRSGLRVDDIGLWEINEAFAAVVVASARELGIDTDIVNVNGGAVALGHPLGASGFRLVMTLALEMQERSGEYGVAAICGGGGQGQAMLLRLPS